MGFFYPNISIGGRSIHIRKTEQGCAVFLINVFSNIRCAILAEGQAVNAESPKANSRSLSSQIGEGGAPEQWSASEHWPR